MEQKLPSFVTIVPDFCTNDMVWECFVPQFLEEDIDAEDPVVPEPGELEGEELLATLALSPGGSILGRDANFRPDARPAFLRRLN